MYAVVQFDLKVEEAFLEERAKSTAKARDAIARLLKEYTLLDRNKTTNISAVFQFQILN